MVWDTGVSTSSLAVDFIVGVYYGLLGTASVRVVLSKHVYRKKPTENEFIHSQTVVQKTHKKSQF